MMILKSISKFSSLNKQRGILQLLTLLFLIFLFILAWAILRGWYGAY